MLSSAIKGYSPLIFLGSRFAVYASKGSFPGTARDHRQCGYINKLFTTLDGHSLVSVLRIFIDLCYSRYFHFSFLKSLQHIRSEAAHIQDG